VYFAPRLKVFPLELGTGAGGQKTKMMGLPDEKEVWRYLQLCGYNTPTRQTDRRTDTGGQQKLQPELLQSERINNLEMKTEHLISGQIHRSLDLHPFLVESRVSHSPTNKLSQMKILPFS